MNHAIETEEGLGTEYDEDVICDLSWSPDNEEENDILFCDKYNISACPLGILFAAYLGVSPLPSNPYYIIRLYPGPVVPLP